MNRVLRSVSIVMMSCFALTGAAVLAQDTTSAPVVHPENLLLFTKYPSEVIGVGEVVTMNLNLHTDTEAQIVDLSLADLPDSWGASFRGSGHIVDSVFVQPNTDATVELHLEPPADTAPGTYDFNVIAKSNDYQSEIPVALTVEEKAPASLAFDVTLPSVRGKPDTTFRYDVTLNNEGDADLTVDLSATAPPMFQVVFKSGAQEVTNVPVKANSSERLSVEVSSLVDTVPADTYPITIEAQGGDVDATTQLTAEVVGTSNIALATADGRLSGDAEAGRETSVNLVVSNSGSAAATQVKLTASQPSGWTVTFSPDQIDRIEPGGQAQVTANLQPADKALAGDYMVTLRAQPDGGTTKTADYRVTVRTSTLWGVAGIGLIALAVGVVGFVVQRFGRR